MLSPEEKNLIINSMPFWQHLTTAEQDLFFENTISVSYAKGAEIHNAMQECAGILYVKEGTIRTYLLSDEGREVTLYRLEAGDICVLSASCVLQAIDFDVFVDADSDCQVLQLNAQTFAKLSAKNVYVELFSYKTATERFSDVMWAMQQILFTSFDKRLAAFLIEESDKSGSNELKITHEQLAKYLGSAREVVSRMLKYFSKEGYLALSRGGITILDKKSLRKLL